MTLCYRTWKGFTPTGDPMKNATRIALLAVGMLALPARASEIGVMVDKQFGKAQTVAVTVPGMSAGAKLDAVSPTGFGIRGAYTVLNLKVAEIGLTGTYHGKAEGDFAVDGVGKIGRLSNEYMAIGAQVDWKFLVNLHVGLDLRREKFTTSECLVPSQNGSTTQTRPWLRAGIGFGIPLPVVTPFVRFEVAMATTKAEDTTNMEEVRKALAPQYQIGLYGGIRF